MNSSCGGAGGSGKCTVSPLPRSSVGPSAPSARRPRRTIGRGTPMPGTALRKTLSFCRRFSGGTGAASVFTAAAASVFRRGAAREGAASSSSDRNSNGASAPPRTAGASRFTLAPQPRGGGEYVRSITVTPAPADSSLTLGTRARPPPAASLRCGANSAARGPPAAAAAALRGAGASSVIGVSAVRRGTAALSGERTSAKLLGSQDAMNGGALPARLAALAVPCVQRKRAAVSAARKAQAGRSITVPRACRCAEAPRRAWWLRGLHAAATASTRISPPCAGSGAAALSGSHVSSCLISCLLSASGARVLRACSVTGTPWRCDGSFTPQFIASAAWPLLQAWQSAVMAHQACCPRLRTSSSASIAAGHSPQ